MKQICAKPIVVTEDVYWKLVELKFQMRVHSIDTVLRDVLDMEPNNDTPVKHYASDEGGFARAPTSNPGSREKCRTV